jgi:hypothetical protein
MDNFVIVNRKSAATSGRQRPGSVANSSILQWKTCLRSVFFFHSNELESFELESGDELFQSEKAYQLAKGASEIKRDMEAILLSNQVAANGNSTTARTLGGLQTWLSSNKSLGTNGTAGSGGTTARVTGTDRTFTADMLNTVMQSAYTNGGSPTMLLVTPAQKVVASTFTGIATRYRDVPSNQQAQIINAADVYVSDFGIIQIVPDRFIPNADSDDCAFLLDTEMAAVSYLRPFQTIELAKTGDAETTQLLVEYTLEVKNEAAHGIIADLT